MNQSVYAYGYLTKKPRKTAKGFICHFQSLAMAQDSTWDSVQTGILLFYKEVPDSQQIALGDTLLLKIKTDSLNDRGTSYDEYLKEQGIRSFAFLEEWHSIKPQMLEGDYWAQTQSELAGKISLHLSDTTIGGIARAMF